MKNKINNIFWVAFTSLILSGCNYTFEDINEDILKSNEELILQVGYQYFYWGDERKNGSKLNPPMVWDKVYVYCLNMNKVNIDFEALENSKWKFNGSKTSFDKDDVKKMITNNIPIVQLSYHYVDPASRTGAHGWYNKTLIFADCTIDGNKLKVNKPYITEDQMEFFNYFPYWYENIMHAPVEGGNWLDLDNKEVTRSNNIAFNSNEMIKISALLEGSDNLHSDSSENMEENDMTIKKEVTIGKQVWMNWNLDVDRFRNGDPIPEAKTDEEWKNSWINKTPAWCYFENNDTKGKTYGKLYNWYAVMDPRGLAPEGWHIPTIIEWEELYKTLGTESGDKLKNQVGWDEDLNGNNQSGFSGLPSGKRDFKGGFENGGNSIGVWWSVDKSDADYVWSFVIMDRLYAETLSIKDGYAVRCLKGKLEPSPESTPAAVQQEVCSEISEIKKDETKPERIFSGRFRVSSERAYFHSVPNSDFRIKSYLVRGDTGSYKNIERESSTNTPYIFVSFTNTNGFKTEGWISMNDIVSYPD